MAEGEDERRQGSRRRMLKAGRIVLNSGRSTINCVVRNRSPEGARLQVETVVGIPEEFELVIATEAPKSCRVVWRSATEIGTIFLEK